MAQFIIKNPIVSEKATQLSSAGKYIFLVERSATKPEIRKTLKLRYKVDATHVNILNTKPKPRRLGATTGVRPGYKKAIVTLKKGQTLDILPH